MLERIGRLGSVVSRDALTLLRWLAYAVRPVTLAELQTATTIRPEDDEVDFEDEGDFRDSLDILAGLVVFLDGANSTKDDGYTQYDRMSTENGNLTPATRVRFAHFSVKEYLESARIVGSSASFFRLEVGVCHRFLSQSRLTYLMSYSKSDDKISPKMDMDKFHLLSYAAEYWREHSVLQSGDDVSREVALLECEDARFDLLRIETLERRCLDLMATPSVMYRAYIMRSTGVSRI